MFQTGPQKKICKGVIILETKLPERCLKNLKKIQNWRVAIIFSRKLSVSRNWLTWHLFTVFASAAFCSYTDISWFSISTYCMYEFNVAPRCGVSETGFLKPACLPHESVFLCCLTAVPELSHLSAWYQDWVDLTYCTPRLQRRIFWR